MLLAFAAAALMKRDGDDVFPHLLLPQLMLISSSSSFLAPMVGKFAPNTLRTRRPLALFSARDRHFSSPQPFFAEASATIRLSAMAHFGGGEKRHASSSSSSSSDSSGHFRASAVRPNGGGARNGGGGGGGGGKYRSARSARSLRTRTTRAREMSGWFGGEPL